MLGSVAKTFILFIVFCCATTTSKANECKDCIVQSANEEFVVSGIIRDDDGMPLIGASILEKGTSNGTITDVDGNFSLTVSSPDAILEVTYIGYVAQEIALAGRAEIDIVLKADSNQLDEVVVIGYGSSRKSDLTGSIVSVQGSKLKEQSINNVAETLTGRLAGVQVLSTEGSPDAEINIRVRGGGSLTQDASPLIIVDGFPVGSMNDIAPSDIATISVLKDASSTAIYGSRGANGVVIITTKSGRSGKVQVNYNTFFGSKKIANTIDVLAPEDFVKWQYEYALLTDDLEGYEQYFGLWQDYDQYQGLQGNDWQRQIYGQAGDVQSHDVAIRGGTEKINYNFNFARYDDKTIGIGSDYSRNNLSLALKSQATDRIELTFNARYSDTEINGGGANEQNEISSADARLRHSVGYSPIPLPGLTTTNTDEALASYLVNPFVAVADNQRNQQRKKINLQGSAEWEVIDNLSLKSDIGFGNYFDLDYRFYGRSTYYSNNRPSAENQGLPSLIFRDRKRNAFRNANTINYDFQKFMGNDHSLKLLVGEEMLIYTNNLNTTEIQGFPADFDFETTRNLTTQGTPQVVDNFYSPDDKLLSFFGRLNYGFKNRYLATFTYRADGSSKFLGDNRWGYFPSAALAWKISEEGFLKDESWIDLIKLRLSYGLVGNNNIPAGQTFQNFVSKNTTYINDVSSYWAASNTLANPNLKWETTTTQNFGIDYGLFKGLLSGTLEFYKNTTSDLLINFPVPGTGYATQFRNMGETQNTGVEASVNIAAIAKEKYGLNVGFNISVNRNKINSLGELEDFGTNTNWASTQIGNDYFISAGSPVGQMYGYLSDGRYEVSDFTYDSETQMYTLNDGVVDNSAVIGDVMPGSMKLKDINGDGIVDVDDNTIIGDANPLHTGGFVLSGYVGGFDLSAAFNWSVGNDVYNANKIEFTTSNLNSQYRNLSTIMADGERWTNLNPETGELVTDPSALEALNASTTMWSPFSSRYVFSDWAVEDGSFLRLNTLTLGYTINNERVTKTGISKLRLYATANNVFVLTNYSGLDPEVSTRRKTPLTPGVDYSPFPKSRQLVFGLNLNF